jgi:tetratricopeptide (TPR) repeat protein
MSEWYDSQKKPNGNIRKLLRERLERAKTRRSPLSTYEEKKLSKLNEILATMTRGKNVQNRQLRRWLTDNEYEQFEAEWETQKDFREELRDKPDELKRYEEKLKEATFYHNRAESYSARGKHDTSKKLYDKSESLCEDALELLQEILYADANIRAWFDREIDLGQVSETGAELASLPRLVTSRSAEKQRDDSSIVKKLAVKISVVERALNSIGREQ